MAGTGDEHGGGRVASARARVEAARDRALDKAKGAPPALLRIAVRFVAELTRIEPFDRAMTLAAQAFTSIFPVVIAAAAFLSRGTSSVGTELGDKLGFSETTTHLLDQTIPDKPDQSAAFGIIGLLVVLVSATSFSRALGRMYARAWGRPPSRWRGGWRWVAVVVAISGTLVGVQWLNHVATGLAPSVAALLLSLLAEAALWVFVPWLLLVRQVSVAKLIPGGALMGLTGVLLYVGGKIYMSQALTSAARHFGAFGVAFTFIGWLFVISFALILTTVLGASLMQSEDVDELVPGLRGRLPRWLRWD